MSKVTCNVCQSTAADFYIVEPIGITNYLRPMCAVCGTLHISNVPEASLSPIDAELTDIEFYNLCLQALVTPAIECAQDTPNSAHVRAKAKRELRLRLERAGIAVSLAR